MLIFLTVFLFAATGLLLTATLKNRRHPALENPRPFETAPPPRPLFAPDDEELRALARAEKERAAELERETQRRAAADRLTQLRNFQQTWRAAPDRAATLELLRLAAATENGPVFAEIAGEILEFKHENALNNLSNRDLAELLDSHFRTLPQQERTSGALFRLREEIAELRAPQVRG